MGISSRLPQKLCAAPSNDWINWASSRKGPISVTKNVSVVVHPNTDGTMVRVLEHVPSKLRRSPREIVRVYGPTWPAVEVVAELCRFWTSIVGQTVDGVPVSELSFAVTHADGSFYVMADIGTEHASAYRPGDEHPRVCLRSNERDDVRRAGQYLVACGFEELASSTDTKSRLLGKKMELYPHVYS